MIEILVGLGGVGIGAGVGLWWSRARARGAVALAESQAKEILERAREEAESARRVAELESKEALLKAKAELEEPIRAERAEIVNREKRLQQREENIEKKADLIHTREIELARREKGLQTREALTEEARAKLEELARQSRQRLERLAGLSTEEARRKLIESLVDEARAEAAKQVKSIEDQAREEASQRAKRIIGMAIQRYAGEHVQERAVTVVQLPSDDMKGRIIGREGRNIRALEAATGVDLIIDDTPEAIILSSFDPIRREVARVAIAELISDGRIHPGRIEEVLEKARAEVEQSIREAGEQAVFELGIHGLHPELVRLVGRLKYRYSFAQNVWRHSIECGYLCGLMAAELGLNIKQARRAGLLHDIGKAVDHEVEGGHAVIGGALARKFGESPKVANAIAAHHEDERPESVLAHLAAASDALSGARPGARREVLESYIKRLEDLEQIASSFPGVEKTYAIQAGREIRVLVENTEVSDEGAVLLSPRDRPQDRARVDLPRTDQGDRGPGVARRGIRQVIVLCIGDIMGKPGRLAMRHLLHGVIHRHAVDLVVANCENACGGMGITPDVAQELFALEVAVLTSGNHIWHKREVVEYLGREKRILRPANFPEGTPGRGHTVVETPGGVLVGVVNIQGRVFMPQLVDDPFRTADRIVAELDGRGVRAIVVDMHAETTSEKVAIARYLDGRVSAVVGTHTHVQTSDEQVLPRGTARICDLGMTGPHDSVIGMKTELVVERFLTQRPVSFEVARRDVRLEGAVVDIDETTGRARGIERVRERLKEPG